MIRINHASAHAHDPKAAAEHLAALIGGSVVPFHPLAGAWACLFEGSWSGAFLELYPRTHGLHAGKGGAVGFRALAPPANGGGAHFNVTVSKSRAELEAICASRGLVCSWRGWGGFLDVWIDEDLLVELVCG
jgi:hypothetical protein